MKLPFFIAYPATLMLIVSAAYVLLAVPHDDRLSVFSMLALGAIGVSELVLGTLKLLRRKRESGPKAHHVLAGAGSLSMSYGFLHEWGTAPLILGAIILSAGLLLWTVQLHNSSQGPP